MILKIEPQLRHSLIKATKHAFWWCDAYAIPKSSYFELTALFDMLFCQQPKKELNGLILKFHPSRVFSCSSVFLPQNFTIIAFCCGEKRKKRFACHKQAIFCHGRKLKFVDIFRAGFPFIIFNGFFFSKLAGCCRIFFYDIKHSFFTFLCTNILIISLK